MSALCILVIVALISISLAAPVEHTLGGIAAQQVKTTAVNMRVIAGVIVVVLIFGFPAATCWFRQGRDDREDTETNVVPNIPMTALGVPLNAPATVYTGCGRDHVRRHG